MDLTDPSMSITSSLDGPVLVALADAGKPMTVSEVARRSARGSEIGIRKSLSRLVTQGIVTATQLGNTRSYSLNRSHVAANAVIEMANLRTELWRRLAREIESWNVRPMYACVFGSAARHDGDGTSDIDLLLVRPATLAELDEARRNNSLRVVLEIWLKAISTRAMTNPQLNRWEGKVDDLRDLVKGWTGNPLQVVSVSAIEWARNKKEKTPIFTNITNDEVRLYDELGPTVYKYPK